MPAGLGKNSGKIVPNRQKYSIINFYVKCPKQITHVILIAEFKSNHLAESGRVIAGFNYGGCRPRGVNFYLIMDGFNPFSLLKG